MRKIFAIWLCLVPLWAYGQGDSVKVSELPAATAPDANDLLFFIQDGASTNITKSLLQKSLRDSLITVMLEVDDAYDSIASHLAQIQAIDDSLARHLDTLQAHLQEIQKLQDSIATIRVRYSGVENFAIDSLGYTSDTLYTTYNSTAVRLLAYAGGGGGAPTGYSDNFDSYTGGSVLAGQGSWVQEYGTVYIYKPGSDGEVYGGVTGEKSAVYWNNTFDGNHYAQMTFTSGVTYNASGPAVRCQGGTGYFYGWHSTLTASYLFRSDGGATWTTLATGTAWTTDDEVLLACNGDTLFCYRNGSLDTSIDSDGYFIDNSGSKLTGGKAGLVAYGNSSSGRADDWYGGDFEGSGIVPGPGGGSSPTEHPMTHDQIYLTHGSMLDGDSVGQVHYLCTDSIFNGRSGGSYSYSIVVGNSDGAFGITSTGMLYVADYTQITAARELEVEISYGTARDTATCEMVYKASPIFADLSLGSGGSGTRADPYGSDATFDGLGELDGGDMLLFKRGTSSAAGQMQIGTTGGQWLYIGAYGTGEKPRFGRSTTSGYYRTFQFGSFSAEDGVEGANMDADSIYICDLEFYGRSDTYTTHNAVRIEEWADEIHFRRCDFDDINDSDGSAGHAWAYWIIDSDAVAHNFSSSMKDCEFRDRRNLGVSYPGRPIKAEGTGVSIENCWVLNDNSSGAVFDLGQGSGSNANTPVRYIYMDGADNPYASAFQIRQNEIVISWTYTKDYAYTFDFEEIDFYTGGVPNPSGGRVSNFITESGGQTVRFEVTEIDDTSDDYFADIIIENGFAQNMTRPMDLQVDSNAGTIRSLTLNKIIAIGGDYPLYVDASETDTILVYNCIFLDGSTTDIYTSNTVGDGVMANTIYNTLTNISHWGSFPYNYDFGSGDPFVDEPDGDYTTADNETSIINQGQYSTGNTKDILGNSIATQDIGPFEFGGENYNWTHR